MVVDMSTRQKKGFSKILVPIDGSEPSMNAAEYAIAVAKRYDATTTIIHIVPQEIRYEYSEEAATSNTNSSVLGGIVESHRQNAEEWFRKIREKSKEEKNNNNGNNIKIDTDVIVATKSIAAEIVDYAENYGFDLIVIGTRGRTGFKKLLLGSVAAAVVTYAHCPVMVTK
jgi:nucleotide-binding universal stress UspA family protein